MIWSDRLGCPREPLLGCLFRTEDMNPSSARLSEYTANALELIRKDLCKYSHLNGGTPQVSWAITLSLSLPSLSLFNLLNYLCHSWATIRNTPSVIKVNDNNNNLNHWVSLSHLSLPLGKLHDCWGMQRRICGMWCVMRERLIMQFVGQRLDRFHCVGQSFL